MRQAEPLAVRHVWLRPVSALYDFTLAEYDLHNGVSIANEKLIEITSKLSDTPSRSDQLCRFLRERASQEVFDHAHKREFWSRSGYPVSEEEWREQVP